MPTSKLMRVRVEVFMKIMATARPASTACGSRRFCAALSSDGEVEQRRDLVRGEVVDGEEAATGEVELGDAVLDGLGALDPLMEIVDCWQCTPRRWPRRRSDGGDRRDRARSPP